LPSYVDQQAGWTVEGDKVHVPANADNDVKATVIREDLQLDRELAGDVPRVYKYLLLLTVIITAPFLELTKFLSQAHSPILRA